MTDRRIQAGSRRHRCEDGRTELRLHRRIVDFRQQLIELVLIRLDLDGQIFQQGWIVEYPFDLENDFLIRGHGFTERERM